jgi:hypothetical protein
MDDMALLDAVPAHFSISMMLKATPRMEGSQRILYIEASNEKQDQQDEVIAAQALAESADYFLKFGNIDIDHYTLIGQPNPAKGWPGIPDCGLYEIGRPVDVRQKDGLTFVKAQIFSGTGPASERANEFWSSLTDIEPAARWYPSVGGQVYKDFTEVQIDPKTHARRAIVKKVRWTNIGMSKTPVNQHVPTCTTMPMSVFAKCCTPAGIDFAKALEAGYGTDSATLTGGGAMRRQSLHGAPVNYFEWREHMAGRMRSKAIKNPGAAELISDSVDTFGLSHDESAEHVERFMRDLKTAISRGTQ